MLPSPDILAADATAELARLVAFDTTSRDSNLALIVHVERLLADLGIATTRVPSADGSKTNLYATIGPAVAGGIVLSGHTDVVPVDGQSWTSDPFTLAARDGRLYGRGTCDMKGFLALALAAAPAFAQGSLARPVHLALSYDEEVGCIGAPAMIAEIARTLPPPAAVIVGEPTNMQVVRGHKGITSYLVTVTGHEAHSSLTHLGLSANMVAVQLMGQLAALAERLEREADPASPFVPPHATLTIGQVDGGTAVNILAGRCTFLFDLRCPPGLDPEAVLAPFLAEAARCDATIKARFPAAGVSVVRRSTTPAFAPDPDSVAERIARSLAGDNGPARVVAYAAEAGQFQQGGFSTVICGPGSIEQAHQPDEYVEKTQIARGASFMLRLAEMLAN
ncbi:acetylornithine deacetylase [Sphingomonas nostoxanthinifaciens]|uniref:acetylornithine deacetylase n=1 Tax=Sphingomonas nostoxanthinifaciens TaxID=2872652 RepID=UPI001CC21410|nr:acetylornithine deacetylase [Sphingomonas nostoxanthinifaciens]UAK24615.1 acetylornithine deacetylase [Sphingomonas nostoxanthinifaciens]